MNITPVILCGGSGTRLWPLSRQHFPKQFIKLIGDYSFFQQAILRIIDFNNKYNVDVKEVLIVTNENHRFLALEQIQEINLDIPFRILLEPVPKNTAPALSLAALASQETITNSTLVVMPSDHFIRDSNTFFESLENCLHAVDEKKIITMGIEPTRPDSSFGYIQYSGSSEIKNVINFKEKPNTKIAKQMLNFGNHAWNSGIFILNSRTWLDAIDQANMNISHCVMESWKRKTIDGHFERVDKEFFIKSPDISIDYAVIEKAKNINISLKLVLLNAGWSDMGGFNALFEVENKDKNGNIFIGDVTSLNSNNSLSISTKKNISLLGVNNIIVIETADSVLVLNRDDSDLMKNLVTIVEEKNKHLLEEHTRVYRPWGYFEVVDQGLNFKVKRIRVKPGAKLSYQSHEFRNEHWVVVKGMATILINDKRFELSKDESIYIKKGDKHQLINLQNIYLEIIEVQTGENISEDDITRFTDDYGRA